MIYAYYPAKPLPRSLMKHLQEQMVKLHPSVTSFVWRGSELQGFDHDGYLLASNQCNFPSQQSMRNFMESIGLNEEGSKLVD